MKRISLMQNSSQQMNEVPETPGLLTLLLSNNGALKMIGEGFFQHVKALRVLDLANTRLTALPTGIAELVSLRYLDIPATNIAELPWESTIVKKLKCLNLDFMKKLREVPRQMISSFPSLQVLGMRACGMDIGRSMVEELESLEFLKESRITRQKDLSVLHQLLGSHILSSCIRYLEIQDIYCLSSSRNESDQKIDIFYEMIGTETQIISSLHKISGNKCSGNLLKVDISFCKWYMEDWTWLSLAPNLTELKATWVSSLEEIISYRKLGGFTDQNEDLNVFTRLRVIELEGLVDLKSICRKPLLFPSHNKIRISECLMLKKLPLNSKSAKGRNLVIEGKKQWWDGLKWEDDATRSTFATCFREYI